MREEDDEEDPDVPSDVPYACAAAFSRRPQDFLGPTRVAGRLPDLTGADEPSYLVKVLGTAARFVCRDPQGYSTHFALTAKVWRRSTRKSALKLFGPDADVFSAPPLGPRWTARQLAPRIHFINCQATPPRRTSSESSRKARSSRLTALDFCRPRSPSGR